MFITSKISHVFVPCTYSVVRTHNIIASFFPPVVVLGLKYSSHLPHNFTYFNHRMRLYSTYGSSVQVATVKELANKLGVDHEFLIQSLNNPRELLDINVSRWEHCCKVLVENGLSVEDSVCMVVKCPSLLLLNENALIMGLRQWRGVNLGEKYVLSLLKTCPQFLSIPACEISHRIAHLKSLGTSKAVVDLLKGAPSVMLDDWNDVVAKLSFLIDDMTVNKKHVLNSFALNRSLIFLKTRFSFLERCGKYVKINPKADPNIPSRNPPLKNIVGTNNEHFALHVASLTLEEYEVFEELYVSEEGDFELNDSESE